MTSGWRPSYAPASVLAGAGIGAALKLLDAAMMAALLVGGGVALNAAFRSCPGPVAVAWQEIRRRRSPAAYAVYSVAGPVLLRAGMACLASSMVASLMRR